MEQTISLRLQAGMNGAEGSRPRAAALRAALFANSPSPNDVKKKQNRYRPEAEYVLATSESASCMSTASALTSDAHTVAARADAGSPSSKGSWLASAPARLQVPVGSDSESWDDVRDDLSATSDDSSDELMTESGCSTSQILTKPRMLSQHAQQAGALTFGPGAQHAQRMSSGQLSATRVAKLTSPPDTSHQHDTSACSPSAALEPEELQTDPLGVQCLSVCVSDEFDHSSESSDQLTAQHIRDRYPHLFQTFPLLATAESLTVRMQLGTVAELAAARSMADLSPLAMRPSAEAPAAADSSLDVSSAADLTINAEALMAAGSSHMTAVPEASQISPAALSSSSGCHRHLPESRGVARVGQSHNGLQKGLLSGNHHDSALRQLLQDTNNELAIRLESCYSGDGAKTLFSDRLGATLPGPVGQLSNRTFHLTDSRDGFRAGLGEGVVVAEHTAATGSRPKAAGVPVMPQASYAIAEGGCAIAEDASAIAEGGCAIAEDGCPIAEGGNSTAESSCTKFASEQAQLGPAAPRDGSSMAASQGAGFLGDHAMPEHGAPASPVADHPAAKGTTAGENLAAAQTHPKSTDTPHTGFLSTQARISTAEDDGDSPAQALNSTLRQLAASEIAAAADNIRAIAPAVTAQLDAAASQPAGATASGSLAINQLNCTTAQCEANTAGAADISPVPLDCVRATVDTKNAPPPATADEALPAAVSTPSLHATDAAGKEEDGRLDQAMPGTHHLASATVALDLSMTDLQFSQMTVHQIHKEGDVA
ncbi:MAG: hypothetical protein FRX49_12440 [Trebouxia sp. A1-2]|nr:MAG: hypothetical protein FRX49_12440 [Trebouxia sp. A1-2]